MTLAGFIVCGSWPAEVLAKVVDHHKDENGVPLVQKNKPLDCHQSTARKSLKIRAPWASPETAKTRGC
jgi:hypothetical protein